MDLSTVDADSLWQTYKEAYEARQAHTDTCLVCALTNELHQARGERCTEFAELDREQDSAFCEWLWHEPPLAESI